MDCLPKKLGSKMGFNGMKLSIKVDDFVWFLRKKMHKMGG